MAKASQSRIDHSQTADDDTDTCDANSNSKAQSPLKFRFCGLDALSHVFARLFIVDIQNLKETDMSIVEKNCNEKQQPSPLTTCYHKGHLVTKVDVIGLVVMVNSWQAKWSCITDDGTGVILCNRWKNTKSNEIINYPPQSQTRLLSKLPKSLLMKQKEIYSSECHDDIDDKFGPSCAVGDVVRIRGRVTLHAERKEIDILSVRVLDSPSFEIDRILELPQLCSIYDAPATVPPKLRHNSLKNSFDDRLTSVILLHIKDEVANIDTFTSNDVLAWPSVINFLKSEPEVMSNITSVQCETIQRLLDSLSEMSGLICCRKEIQNYEVIKSDCHLCKLVCGIVRTACQSERNAEKGCHQFYIKDKLHHSTDYPLISDCVVERVLTQLELDSEVICIDQMRYMAV